MFAARLSRASSIVSPQEGTSIVHNSKSPTILALYKLFYQLIFCHHRLVGLLGEEITGQGSNPGQSPYAARGARARRTRSTRTGRASLHDCRPLPVGPRRRPAAGAVARCVRGTRMAPVADRSQGSTHGSMARAPNPHAWRRGRIGPQLATAAESQ